MAELVDIDFTCGHSEERDISAKAAGERAGYVAWLGSTKCTQCWSKGENRKVSKKVTDEREARQAEALQDQDRSKLPPLQGSEKQVDWATRVRFEMLQDAYISLVESGELDEEKFEEEVVEPARRISRAKWWIDNREEGSKIMALLADPGEGVATENPY